MISSVLNTKRGFMIRNQWYAIIESKSIKSKPFGLVRLNEKLVLWRDSQHVLHCIYDRCCHRGASLSEGCLEGDYLACPFHGFKYNAKGNVVEIPANGKDAPVPERFKVNAYPVKEAYGMVWLWYGEFDTMTEEIPFFEDLKDGFIYNTFQKVWPVHYSRAIENQLDVVHLPYVHKTTIGKNMGTLVNGPVVKWHDNRMVFYVNNVEDRGQAALKPHEIINYQNLFSLEFQMPNIWQNKISDQVRIFAAFAPIDERQTMIYIRFYQKFLKIPILGKVLGQISNNFNKIILHQDRDVVMTQVPVKSELKMDEMLIQGDFPIIEYRKRRHQLKEKENES